MNIIQRFVRLLSGGEMNPKTQEPPIQESVTKPPPDSSPKPECVLFANDDSPPGYKIRWHH